MLHVACVCIIFMLLLLLYSINKLTCVLAGFLGFFFRFFLGRSSLLLSYCLTYGYPTFLHPSNPRLQMPLTWSVSECCFMEVNGWGCFCYFRQQPRILPLFSNIFLLNFYFSYYFLLLILKFFFLFFLNQCAGNK